jgi:hypothetical protein
MLAYVDTLIGFAGVMLLLSLLVTTVVQLVGHLFELRGWALLWGVERLVERAVPGVKGVELRGIADAILKHPTLSPDGGRATAIRSDELVRILSEVVKTRSTEWQAAEDKVKAAQAALDAARNKKGERDPDEIAKAEKALGEAQEAEQEAAAQSLAGTFDKARDGAAQTYQAFLQGDIAKMFPGDAEKIQAVVEGLAGRAKESMADVKTLFDTVMDRTTERFTRWTRYVTLGTAAFLAVVLQIDSLGILQQISSNPDLRARVTQSADAAMKVADDLRAKDQPIATQALKDALLKAAPGGKPLATKEPVPAELTARQDGYSWIETHFTEDPDRTSVRKKYDLAYDALLPQKVKELVRSARDIQDKLGQVDLVVMSKHTPFTGPWAAWWARSWRHPAGVFLTILFLSLGGPFWYGVLRTFASLRPVLAGKVDNSERSST